MTHLVSHRATLTSLALAALAMSSASSAFAQTAPDNNNNVSNSDSANQVIVTATRSPQLTSDVISDTLVINADQIAQSGAGSIVDLLQRQRGIEVSTNGGPGTTSSVFIRGANSNQNVVLVDGVRIGSSTTGAANWSAIPLSAIDHIEIVYGPLSTLYGADAIGGVIQIFTKKGAGAPSVTASVGAGTYNTNKYDGSVSGSTGGDHNFSYAIQAGKEQSTGFPATLPGNYSYNPYGSNDGYNKQNTSGQFGFQLAKGQEIGLVFLNSHLDAQFDNGPSTYNSHSVQNLDNIAVYSKNQILSNWQSLVQVSQTRDDQATYSSADPVYGFSQINTKQTDLTWQNDINIGSDVLQLLYGYRKEQVVSSSTPELGGDRTTNSFAASYNMKRGNHLLNVSVRDDDSSQYGSKVTGALGYGYRITDTLRATASYGTSFRAPSFNELYYPGYGIPTNKPEQGRNAEAGLRYDDGVTQLSAVYYHNRITDLIVNAYPCPFEPQTYSYGCAYNVDHAVLQGVTLAGSRKLGDFTVRANIDLQNPVDQTTDTVLARRAKKHANFGVDYGTGALKAGLEWELSGARFDDAANQNQLGGYGLLNLYSTYQITPDWSTLIRWNNIADKKYQLAQYYQTPGTTVFVGLRYGYK